MTEPEVLHHLAIIDPFQNHPPFFAADPFRERSERDWQLLAARYVPSHYTNVLEHPEGLGIVYSGQAAGKHFAIAYAGNAGKSSWHHAFRSSEQMQREINQFFEGLTRHRDFVAERRKTDNEPHNLKVGDIITNSWGYDQTNVDWYRVTKTTAHFVWLQPIAAVTTEATGPFSGRCEPEIDTSQDDPTRWTVKDAKGQITKHKASGQHVTMKHGCGSKWDGRATLHCSWGH